MADELEIFLVCAPGLEALLSEEARAAGFRVAGSTRGGVTLTGGWPDVWRANLCLRGAARVLVRIAQFRAMHLAQLDKRARKVAWRDTLPQGASVKVEASCRASRIYHARAARERVAAALVDAVGARVSEDGAHVLKLRIEDDLATISIDTSGEPLHRRGFKEWVGKAPMRESMAALFLRACGHDGSRTVVDPMCGSGTFVLEAAEIAMGLQPGRARPFAFERLAGFDPERFAAMKSDPAGTDLTFHGSDRDAGAARGAAQNADRAGISHAVEFQRQAVSDVTPPAGAPGLVMVNPPYGARIGNRKPLFALYGALGQVLSERFGGWDLGLVTSDAGLARATGLDLEAGVTVDHGGQSIRLYRARIG